MFGEYSVKSVKGDAGLGDDVILFGVDLMQCQH